MVGFLIGEALRDLRRVGRIGVAAVLLMAISLAALGCFWLLSINLGQAVHLWRDRVRIVAYLRDDPGPAAADQVARAVEGLGGVQRVRYVSKAEALEDLKRSLGAQADVVDQLPRNPLPASFEITLDPASATPDGALALAERLAALPEVEEVQGDVEWVESLARWQNLLRVVGLGVGGVFALAAILTVTTATTLVLHVRRQEIEVMRLVGASERVIRLPFLLQGMAQGLGGRGPGSRRARGRLRGGGAAARAPPERHARPPARGLLRAARDGGAAPGGRRARRARRPSRQGPARAAVSRSPARRRRPALAAALLAVSI